LNSILLSHENWQELVRLDNKRQFFLKERNLHVLFKNSSPTNDITLRPPARQSTKKSSRFSWRYYWGNR